MIFDWHLYNFALCSEILDLIKTFCFTWIFLTSKWGLEVGVTLPHYYPEDLRSAFYTEPWLTLLKVGGSLLVLGSCGKLRSLCCLITTWCSEQPDSTTGFLWHHPSCGGNPHYCLVQVKIQSPCFTFSKTTLRGCHIAASAPIQLCWHGWIWAPVFSLLFDWRGWLLFW